MAFGAARRKVIVDAFERVPDARYYVNCRYRPQLKDDPDLRLLIKRGYLKAVREGRGWARGADGLMRPNMSSGRRTYLTKA